jgi:hypothetical protein
MDNIEAANLVEQHLTEFACYSAAPILSIVIVFGLLAPKYRRMSRWLRSIFVVLAITGPIWSALGFCCFSTLSISPGRVATISFSGNHSLRV